MSEQLSRIEAKLEEVAKAVVDTKDSFDAPSSGEFTRTPSGTLQFRTHGPFWRNVLIFGWQRASTSKKMQLIIGGIGGQGVIVWLAQLAKHYAQAHCGLK